MYGKVEGIMQKKDYKFIISWSQNLCSLVGFSSEAFEAFFILCAARDKSCAYCFFPLAAFSWFLKGVIPSREEPLSADIIPYGSKKAFFASNYMIKESFYHISYMIYHISYIIYHISYIIYHISYIIYHDISYIIYYIRRTLFIPYRVVYPRIKAPKGIKKALSLPGAFFLSLL